MTNSTNSENLRLEEVNRYLQLDFNKMSELQDIVDLATQLCDKPIALITILDEHVNWLKVRSGVDVEVMPRETSFCQYGIQQNDMLIIPDATKDDRFDDNPTVTSGPNIRFYAGAPLILDNGMKLGTLCLFDSKPNSITALQQKTLSILSRQVTSLLELALSDKLLKQQIEETEAKNASLMKIAFTQAHEIRQPLASIMGLVGLIKNELHIVDENWITMMNESANTLDGRIKSIIAETTNVQDQKIKD